MIISLLFKDHDTDILIPNETWFKSKVKMCISNYNIAHNERPRRQGVGAAIVVRNNIKFDIVDSYSSIDTENEAIIILLKDSNI